MRRVWIGKLFFAAARSHGWFIQCRRPRLGGWYVEAGLGRKVLVVGYSPL